MALDILAGWWAVLAQMAPYLLFGFAVAGVLSELISPRYVERHLGAGALGPVVKASILGVPLPLCSCGVIPVAASLRRHGASRGATTSFLISTPQTGVDSIFVTYSLLGGVFALFRPIVAFLSGVLGGVLVNLVGGPARGESGGTAVDACAAAVGGRGGRLGRMLRYGFVTLPGDIGRSLLVGLVLAALITAFLPPSLLADVFGRGIGSMLFMLVVGVPIYVCATASVPIAAALIATENVTPGAALVFLMTGPATNGATIAMVWKVMGSRAAVIYLGSVMATALASGLALDGLFAATDLPVPAGHIHEAGASPWEAAAAVVLLVVLLAPLVRPWLKGRLRPAPARKVIETMRTRTIIVAGMTCSHCAATVERALGECAGVASASVDLKSGRAVVVGEQLDADALREAVEAVGYSAEVGADEA